jgi:hypothetical protein
MIDRLHVCSGSRPANMRRAQEVWMKRGRMGAIILLSCILAVGLFAACNGESGVSEPGPKPDDNRPGGAQVLPPQPQGGDQPVTSGVTPAVPLPTEGAGSGLTPGPGEPTLPGSTPEGAAPDELPSPDPNAAVIAGKVTGKDGKILVGARVGVTKGTAPVPEIINVTNEKGIYIWALPAGTFTLTAFMDGYADQSQEITVEIGKVYALNFTLEPKP